MNDTDDLSEDREDSTEDAAEGLPHENPNRPREYHGARTVIAGAGVVIAVAAALWLTLLQPSGGGDGGVVDLPAWLPTNGLEVGSNIGQLAPDFDLETVNGSRFRLSDWRGQPVLINFWGVVVRSLPTRSPSADPRAGSPRRNRVYRRRRQHRGIDVSGAQLHRRVRR